MNDQLVQEGWVAPARPGPARRTVVAVVVAGLLLVVVGWGLVGTGWLREAIEAEQPRRVPVTVDRDGEIVVDGRVVEAEQRRRVGSEVPFLVARATAPGDDGRRVAPDVDPPAGIDAASIAVRVLQPDAGRNRAELLVTVPIDSLPASAVEAAGDLPSLRAVTEPFDVQLREQRADRRRQLQLREGWWWIAPLALLVSVVVPLLLWWRARRRFFSMRVPGPGKQLDAAPPSSVDPIGAAVLVAGARRVDAPAAFAGHLLDLVERRRLPMRRSTTTPPGLGTLIGMHHAEEVDDVIVPLLGELVDDDGYTVVLPDTPARVRRLSPEAIDAWRDHLAARAAFERVVERPDVRIVAFAGAVAIAGAVASAVGWLLADGYGERSTLMLATTALLVASATLVACALDVRHWRVVARARRTERAQWLEWRARSDDPDGAASDQRNLPVLVAIDAPLRSLRGTTPATAVDLDAVTTTTLAALGKAFDHA